MNRRELLKRLGVSAAAAGLVLPATLAENIEEGKKVWALGGLPEPTPERIRFLNDGESGIGVDAILSKGRIISWEYSIEDDFLYGDDKMLAVVRHPNPIVKMELEFHAAHFNLAALKELAGFSADGLPYVEVRPMRKA